MICLADNDIVWKLAACDLISETCALLGTTPNDVQLLPDAHRRFSNRRELQYIADQCGPQTVGRIQRLLQSASKISLAADAKETVALIRPGMDAGERVFLAVQDLSCRMITGDKNCLQTLTKYARTQEPAFVAVHGRWQGRIAWFDQILLALIAQHGESIIHNRIYPGCACDEALLRAFHAYSKTPVEDVIGHLKKRVDTLESQTDGLLMAL